MGTNPSSDSNLRAGRQSASVDNETTDKYNDILIGGSFTGPSSGAAAGRIEIWAYGSYDGGTDFTSDCTGTDGNLTLVEATKFLLKGPVWVITTNSEVYKWGPVALSPAFEGLIPSDWGLWGVHNAGGALTASTTEWQGVKIDIA